MRRRRLLQALLTPLGGTAALLLALVLALAILGPILWGDQAKAIDTDALSQRPSAEHPLGTDNAGRDILFRVLVATRLSVELALLASLIGVTAGLLLGALPWLLGRRGGRTAAAVISVLVAFPAMLLVLFLAVIFGVGVDGAVLAVGFAMAPWFARVTSTLVAGVAGRDFIAVAQTLGMGRFKILLRHILPNVGAPLVINATIGAGTALLAFAGLSFLGLGVQAPQYDWGLLLHEGLNGIYVNAAGAIAPGVAIVLAGLAFNLVGEATAKSFGPGDVHRSRRVAGNARSATANGSGEGGQPDVAAVGGRPGTVLSVEDLHVSVVGPEGRITPVRGVSFSIEAGEAVGLVGESGSGKSLTAMATAQLIEEPNQVTASSIRLCGTEISRPGGESGVATLLGTSLGVVFQDPSTSLNPTMRVGTQLVEGVRKARMTKAQARERAVTRLRDVRVPAPGKRVRQYPHEFSGGMRQRAMIAMATMGEPALIVADEPTTALDVTVQRQVLQLLHEIRSTQNVALLFISHDLTVVEQLCDRVLVMYAGRVVEDLPSAQLSTGARHPYTRALLAAAPDMSADKESPLPTIPGLPVDPRSFPAGCAFAVRCPLADDRCRADDPALVDDGDGHKIACWHAGEVR